MEYHLNNPNFRLVQDVPPVQFIGPPLQDAPPRPKVDQLPQFPGMADNVYDALKRDLEVVMSNELRRSILQGENPLLAFVDALLANGGYRDRSEFIYDLEFFSDPIQQDKAGKRIRSKRDMDLREKDNSGVDVNDFDFDDDADTAEEPEESDGFNDRDIEKLTKAMVAYDSLPGMMVRFLTSRQAAPIRAGFKALFKQVGQIIDYFYGLYSRWTSQRFRDSVSFIGRIVKGSVQKLLKGANWAAGKSLEILKVIFDNAGSVVNRVYDLFNVSIVGKEIQSYIQNNYEAQHHAYIGEQVGTYFDQVQHDPMSDYRQLTEAFCTQLVMSSLNQLALAHHRVDIPKEATEPPDADAYYNKLMQLVFIQALPHTQPTSSQHVATFQDQPLIGVNFSISGDRKVKGFAFDPDGRMVIEYEDANAQLDPLTLMINSLAKQTQTRRAHEEMEWYTHLLPMMTIIQELGKIHDVVEDEKVLGKYWVHPIRLAMETMRGALDENIKEIITGFKRKIQTQFHESDVEEKRTIQELQEAIYGSNPPDTTGKTAAEKKMLMDEYNARQVGKLSIELAKAQLRYEKAQDAYLAAINANNNTQKQAQDTFDYTKKNFEEVQARFDRARHDLTRLELIIVESAKRLVNVEEAIGQSYERIQERIKFKEKILEDIIKSIENIADVNDKKAEAEKGFKAFDGEIDKIQAKFEKTHHDYIARQFQAQFLQRHDQRQPNMAVNQVEMNEFAEARLRKHKEYNLWLGKIRQVFKDLRLVSYLYEESQDPNIKVTSKINTVEANINRMRALADVLVILEMLEYQTIFPSADTNIIRDPVLDGIKDEEQRILQQYRRGEDALDPVIAKLKQEVQRQSEFESKSVREWRQLQRTNRFFISDPKDKIRINTFEFFSNKLTPLELNFFSVIFKPRIKGSIQQGADEINAIARNQPDDTKFEPLLLMTSSEVRGNFAKFVMFIYDGRGVSDPAKITRGLSPYATGNVQVVARNNNRTRFNMKEDGQLMEAVVSYFRDVQVDPFTGFLVYRPGSSMQPLALWQVPQQTQRQQVLQYAQHQQNRPQQQPVHLNIAVLKPYKITGPDKTKRQRVDYHY